MLYDAKRWDRPQTELDSVADLIRWLEGKPADALYCWISPRSCLLAEYLGRKAPATIPKPFNTIVFPGADMPTYGKALERARKVLKRANQ